MLNDDAPSASSCGWISWETLWHSTNPISLCALSINCLVWWIRLLYGPVWARTAVTEPRNLPRSSPGFHALSPTLAQQKSLSTSNHCGYQVLPWHAAVIYATYIYAPAQGQVRWWWGVMGLYSSLTECLLVLTLVTQLHLYTIWLSSLTMTQLGSTQQVPTSFTWHDPFTLSRLSTAE